MTNLRALGLCLLVLGLILVLTEHLVIGLVLVVLGVVVAGV